MSNTPTPILLHFTLPGCRDGAYFIGQRKRGRAICSMYNPSYWKLTVYILRGCARILCLISVRLLLIHFVINAHENSYQNSLKIDNQQIYRGKTITLELSKMLSLLTIPNQYFLLFPYVFINDVSITTCAFYLNN